MGIEEVTYQERSTAFVLGLHKKLHSITYIRTPILRSKVQQLAYDKKDMLPSLLGRNITLYLV